MKQLPAITALAAALGCATLPAHADGRTMDEPLYELSAQYTRAGYAFPGASPMFGAGLHLTERNGILGGGLLVALLGWASAIAANQTHDYVGSTYGPGYRVDWYEERSEEEIAASRRAHASLMNTLYRGDHVFELDAYLPQAGVDGARGGRLALYFLRFGRRRSIEFGFRVGMSYQDLDVTRHRATELGAPLRLLIPLGSRAVIHTEVLLGWVGGLSSAPMAEGVTLAVMPVSAGLTLDATDRLFVRGTASTAAFADETALGFTVELGGRL
jgi:hypothetical protein